MYLDLPARRLPVLVGLRPQRRARVPAFDLRVPTPQVRVALRVRIRDESLFFAPPLSLTELLVEAGYDTGAEATPLAFGTDAVRAFVIAPKALRRLREKPVNVLSDFEVGRGPAEFEHLPGACLQRQVRGHQDDADEEVPPEDAGEDALAGVRARLDLADVAKPIPVRSRGGGRVEVVDEHQPTGLVHRGLRLVEVGAVGEREQAHDPAQHRVRPAARTTAADGQSSGGGVDGVLAADARERGAVRGLIVDKQHLVDVLVRKLVLEHLADDAPRLLEDELAGQ
jgi:hypothetical protein